MTLTEIELLNGFLSLILVSISIIVGLTIASKYFKYRERSLLFVGFTWIGIFAPWMPSATTFIVYLTTGQVLSVQLYLLIGNVTAPVVVVIWIAALCDLLKIKKKKLVLITFIILGVILEIFFFYFLITNPAMIGSLNGPIDIEYKAFGYVFIAYLLIVFITTNTTFGIKSIKSNQPEIKLKGIFFLLATYSFIIGSIMDAFLPLNIITLTIARIILASSALMYYIAFVLPNFIKKAFLKEA